MRLCPALDEVCLAPLSMMTMWSWTWRMDGWMSVMGSALSQMGQRTRHGRILRHALPDHCLAIDEWSDACEG